MAIQKTRNDIVEFALTLVGAKAAEEDATAADLQIASEALDDMVKDLQATGAHLWQRDFATLFLQPEQKRYQIGGSSTDKATADDTFQTSLSAAASSGATSVTLTSVTSLSTGDNFGIKQDDGTIHWTTVSTISTANVVTFPLATTDSASSGNFAFGYTTDLGKALRVPSARRIQQSSNTSDATEIPMVQMGRTDYENLPNKSSEGIPVQYYYDPKDTFGYFYVWPVANTTSNKLDLTVYQPIDVFSDADDPADFPNEWTSALKYNLAVRIAPLYDQTLPDMVLRTAERTLTNALNWDQGDAPVHFAYSPHRWQ